MLNCRMYVFATNDNDNTANEVHQADIIFIQWVHLLFGDVFFSK